MFIFNGRDIIPRLFLAPRGLITVLLFFYIPEEFSIGKEFQGVLLFVILGTCLIMTWSLVEHKNRLLRAAEAEKDGDADSEETPDLLSSDSKKNEQENDGD